MSPDVAGATLMAAGASSPELFAALTSIFITHSALGIGTVVGSEIFNQLVICAGAIFASKSNLLILDPVVLVRDVIFYIISLGLLFNALSDRRIVDDGSEHVFITAMDAYLLFGFYILYVLTCANYSRLLSFLNIRNEDEDQQHYELSQSKDEEGVMRKKISLRHISSEMPYVRSCGGKEPSPNFHASVDKSSIRELYVAPESGLESDYYRQDAEGAKRSGLFLVNGLKPKPRHVNGIDDVERGEDGTVSLFLWQRSAFYDMARVDMNAWQLRWFTFSKEKIVSTPHRTQNAAEDRDATVMPRIHSFDADDSRLMMSVRTQNRDFIFLSPSRANFETAIEGLGKRLNFQEDESDEGPTAEKEIHGSLIAFPVEGFTTSGFIMYCVTFPVKACIQFTIPDVRSGTSVSPHIKAGFASLASIISLTVGSYAMATSLEELSHELNIPESIVGVTISAAGTSLPNLISSRCAARLGLGNMAISNVMGSNTFNILVGLGVPWTLYTALFGVEYSDLPSDGIDESMAVMAASLIIFILMLLKSGCKLFLWHAYLFCILYALFVAHIIVKYFI